MSVNAKIIIDMGDVEEAKNLAGLFSSSIGNDDPAKGPMHIIAVELKVREEPVKPSFVFGEVHGNMGYMMQRV